MLSICYEFKVPTIFIFNFQFNKKFLYTGFNKNINTVIFWVNLGPKFSPIHLLKSNCFSPIQTLNYLSQCKLYLEKRLNLDTKCQSKMHFCTCPSYFHQSNCCIIQFSIYVLKICD